MKFAVFQLSRRGGRAVNEDRMGYCYTREAGLFLLADGMGGHAEGEVAAQMALQSIATQFQREATPTLANVQGFLAASLLTAHRQILRYALERHMPDTPRTTLVAAVVQHGQVTWVHCGDSRLYWVRQGQLLKRTRDHSFAEMARSGALPSGDPRLQNRNVLFTCLGAAQRPVFDMDGPHPLLPGDRLLLCSDGLWDVLPEATLLHGLCATPLDAAVPSLVDAALLAAGVHSDNVTALAMEWQQDAELPAAVAALADDTGFQTTIQPEVPGMEALEGEALEEAEIERSIAEINASIRRAQTRPR
ncbi:MAG: serine/threonine-protein phosphatase [Comamonas sp.]